VRSPNASATVLFVTRSFGGAEHVRSSEQPELRSPVLLVAFEGWNDAGDAASTTAHHLIDRWNADLFADIDPEEFFDFTAMRPTVEIVDGFERELHWPNTSFYGAQLADAPFDVIILLGVEPQMRWRTFCEQILETARACGAEMIVTLGALLADVPHTRPVQVLGTAYDEATALKLGLEPSNYEGPTGILGVLHAQARDAGFTVASLWATVPAYVPGATSPKAALALVERLTSMLDVSVYTTDLEIASVAYERQITELVSEDEETAEFVVELETRHDEESEMLAGDDLMDEVEQFLRDLPTTDTED
jgi:proteasome assembly chaperone (PAC2) family protein